MLALSRPKRAALFRTVPPSAASIGAADRYRAPRLFRLTRSAPCGLKAAPATGRPVVSLPPSEKADWGRAGNKKFACFSAGIQGEENNLFFSASRNEWKAYFFINQKHTTRGTPRTGAAALFYRAENGRGRTRSGGKGRGEKAILWVKITAAAR